MLNPLAKPTLPKLQGGHRLARGQRGSWLFYEGNGTVLNDSSNVNLAYTPLTFATAAPAWQGGSDGYSLNFVGASSQYVVGPASTSAFGFANADFTVLCRAKTTTSASQVMVGLADAGGSGWWIQTIVGGASIFSIRGATGVVVVAPQTTNVFNDGNFHDFVGIAHTDTTTPANNTASLYVDGAFQVSAVGTTAAYVAPTSALTIGCRQSASPATFWTGNISSVMFWNRQLTGDDIARLSHDPFMSYRRKARIKSTAIAPTIFFRRSSSRVGTRASTRQTWNVT